MILGNLDETRVSTRSFSHARMLARVLRTLAGGYTAATMRRLLPWIAILGTFAAAAIVRYHVIEPEGYAFLCQQGGPWWCRPRDAVILAFQSRAIGWLALAAAVTGFVLRARTVALAGAMCAAAGLILYDYDLSAVALVLATLVLVRPAERQSASTGSA